MSTCEPRRVNSPNAVSPVCRLGAIGWWSEPSSARFNNVGPSMNPNVW